MVLGRCGVENFDFLVKNSVFWSKIRFFVKNSVFCPKSSFSHIYPGPLCSKPDKKGPVPMAFMKMLTYSLIEGLYFLKKEVQFIHRDIKPSNILLCERDLSIKSLFYKFYRAI